MRATRQTAWATLLVTLLAPAGLLAGQKVKFGHLTMADGLPEASVTTMLQDRLGFLWIGTPNGLVKYDGYNFTSYKPDPNDSSSIGGRLVMALYEDQAGELWVGTRRGGLNRFDRATEKFTRYMHDPDDPGSLSFDAVGAIFEDSRGDLWVGTGDMESKDPAGGLNRFDRETGTFTRFFHDADDPNSLSHDVVFDIREDTKGDLWIATSSGLNRMESDTGAFTRFLNDPDDPESLSHNYIGSLTVDHEGSLWIATYGGLELFDPESGGFRHFRHDPEARGSLSSDHISTLFVDQEGTLWVGTWHGVLHRYWPESRTFSKFEHDPDDAYSLGANGAIMTIFEDRTDILWIGTWAGGLNKLDPFSGKFPHYGHEPNNPNSLSNDQVVAFHEDRAGNLWIGTKGGGLNRFNAASDTYTHFRHRPDDPTSIGSDRIVAILEDRFGSIWIAAGGAGLDRFNPDGETFTHFTHDADDASSLSDNHVLSLHEDSAGRFWVGTAEGGLSLFDRATGTFEVQGTADENASTPTYARIIHEDSDGTLWIGTEGGLVHFEPTSQTFTTYLEPLTGLDIIMSIHEDRSGRLWVGTFNGGLHLFDREAGTSRPFTQKDGLVHDTVYNILEDGEGRLWLSTGNGMSRFNPDTESFRSYGVEDGLQSHQFGGGAIRKQSGEMAFGGSHGINAFFPEYVKDNPYPPQVALTWLKVMNQELEPGEGSALDSHISIAQQVTLGHDQNAVAIGFSGLHFGHPEQNRYTYRLDPLDQDWVQAGTHRYASYSNLRPGNYEFRVRAANSDGLWNEEGTSVKLTIQPPWWQSWWAYGLFGLVAAVTVVGVDRARRNRLVSRERARSKQQEERLRAEAAELQAKAAEAEARALRAVNERQTLELEEARTLQLSMLPEVLPQPPNLEIAAYMKTATEVGGDYYDFDLSPDGTLTVAIGDATGHGTKAGTMVTATKVLFNLLVNEPDGVRVLQEATRIIKRLNMQNLFMALALGKLKDNRLEIAGAGMPPTLVHRAATHQVEEIDLEGAPLGSFTDFPYRTRSIDLQPGDTVVMMSDGLPEMVDSEGEVFGYDRVGSVLQEAGSLTPQGVIDHFSQVASGWANGRPQDDDVTLVVMRMKAA
jgi:ligand-binding sensor domain-containing protein/serine phosphatase RsbU (regulator of sigma subunit)